MIFFTSKQWPTIVLFALLLSLLLLSFVQRPIQAETQQTALPVVLPTHQLQPQALTPPAPRAPFSNVLLVVFFPVVKLTQIAEQLPFFERLYSQHFSRIALFGDCGKNEAPEVQIPGSSSVLYCVHNTTNLSYTAMTAAMTRFPTGFDGYLFAQNDIMVFPWNMNKQLDPSLPITSNGGNWLLEPSLEKDKSWVWFASEYGYRAVMSAKQAAPQTFPGMRIWTGYSTVFYVPAWLSEEFKQIATLFYEHRVFQEIAVATSLQLITPAGKKLQKWNGQFLWGEERKSPEKFLKDTSCILSPFSADAQPLPFYLSLFCSSGTKAACSS